MSLLFRKLAISNVKYLTVIHNESQLVISSRNFSILPSIYDSDPDPAPMFFSSNIQTLLKRLTRPDFAKVFRKRTNSGLPVLKTPKYKFLTDEELNAEVAKAHQKAERLLQMPPIVKVNKPIDDVISRDPALIGYDANKYLFTDITFGVPNEYRFVVERDSDGTLRHCDHDVRKRLNQVYFPIVGRKLKEPAMFTDEDKLNRLLDGEKYEFILDRACIQYEPDEAPYQRVTSITYQHVDLKKKYDLLRSTRHFGPLTFYLTWHHSIEGLLLEMLQCGVAREAVLLIALRHDIHGDVTDGDMARNLIPEILQTPILLSKPDSLTESDIDLDNKCIECIEKYITSNSSMKSQQELALQGLREWYQQLVELSRGLRKAHGNA